MLKNAEQEQQARQEWIEKITQGQLTRFEGKCKKCEKSFNISCERNDEDLITTSLTYHAECLKTDHDPEIHSMIVKALENQPGLPWTNT